MLGTTSAPIACAISATSRGFRVRGALLVFAVVLRFFAGGLGVSAPPSFLRLVAISHPS
jgi:hypothetical protein